MDDELTEKNLPEEGDRDQKTGKVWHSGAWWDELEWQQYLLDRERQQCSEPTIFSTAINPAPKR
jgi:hypothetical protein